MHELGVDGLLFLIAVVLQFQVKIALAEYLFVFKNRFLGLCIEAFKYESGNLACKTG